MSSQKIFSFFFFLAGAGASQKNKYKKMKSQKIFSFFYFFFRARFASATAPPRGQIWAKKMKKQRNLSISLQNQWISLLSPGWRGVRGDVASGVTWRPGWRGVRGDIQPQPQPKKKKMKRFFDYSLFKREFFFEMEPKPQISKNQKINLETRSLSRHLWFFFDVGFQKNQLGNEVPL